MILVGLFQAGDKGPESVLELSPCVVRASNMYIQGSTWVFFAVDVVSNEKLGNKGGDRSRNDFSYTIHTT